MNNVLVKSFVCLVMLCSFIQSGTASEVALSVVDVEVRGDTLSFDVYAKNETTTTAWLSDCSFYIEFNDSQFTDPQLIVTTGDGKLSQASRYQYQSALVNGICAIDLVQTRTITSVNTAAAFCEELKTTGIGTKIATVKISGRTGFEGMTDVEFNTSPPFVTLVFCYLNETPFNTSPTQFDNNYAEIEQDYFGPYFSFEIRDQTLSGSVWSGDVYARYEEGPQFGLGTSSFALSCSAGSFSSATASFANAEDGNIDNHYTLTGSVDSDTQFEFSLEPETVTSAATYDEYIEELPSSGSWVFVGTMSLDGFDMQTSLLDANINWTPSTTIGWQLNTSPWTPNADITANGEFSVIAPVVTLDNIGPSTPDAFFCDGETMQITWDSENLSFVDIFLSEEGNLTQIANNVVADSGTYEWEVDGVTFGNSYRIVVVDNAKPDVLRDSTGYTFTTYAPIEISEQPTDATICNGDSAYFSVSAVGIPEPQYQWQVSINGDIWSDINGAVSSDFAVEAIEARDGFSYRVVCSNTCGSTTSDAAMLSVAEPVTIVLQPQSATVCEGEDAVFAIDVNSKPSAQVRWQINSGNGWTDEGTIGDTLTIQQTSSSDDQLQVRARIIQFCGDTLSNIAILTIHSAPSVAEFPKPDTVCEGETAMFTVAFDGSPAPEVQWQHSFGAAGPWTDFDDGQRDTLYVPDVHRSWHLRYVRAVINNDCGTIETPNVWTAVQYGPEFLQHPQSDIVCEGEDVSFAASLSSRPAANLQWQERIQGDWQDISGENSNSLTVFSVGLEDNGAMFRLQATGICKDTVYSDVAEIGVLELPRITQEPVDADVCEGSNAIFTVELTPTTATVQWQQKRENETVWTEIVGANSTQLLLPDVSVLQHLNTYRAVVQTSCGEVVSTSANLIVDPVVTVLEHPESVTVLPTQTAVFSAIASESAVSWQWFKEGNALFNDGRISGAQSAELTIEGVTITDASASYYAVVTEGCGSDTTNLAALNVDVPEIDILTQPSSVEVCEVETVMFTVEATTAVSSATLSYQWYKGGVPLVDDGRISGSKTAQLTIAVVHRNDASSGYSVKITAIPGGVFEFSRSVTLKVNAKPILLSQTSLQNVCVDSDVVLAVEAQSTNQQPIEYQWFHNDQEVVNGTNRTISFEANTQTLGIWYCKISNLCGTIESQPIEVSVKRELETHIPDGLVRTVDENENTVLKVQGSGSGILRYQWLFNGKEIQGATRDSLVIFEATVDDEGHYVCEVTDDCTSVTSDAIRLNVNPVSVDENTGKSHVVVIYPNPATDVLNVDLDQELVPMNGTFSLVDIVGNTVVAGAITSPSIHIALDGLSNGTYVLVLQMSDRTIRKHIKVLR